MDTNPNIGSEPGASPGSQQGRRLTRRMDQRMIAGVAAGLGDYFGIDPVWLRLGFVLAALLGGAGIIVYGVMWLIVPPVEGPVPGQPPLSPRMERLARSMDRTPAWVGVVLIVVGGLLLASRLLSWHPGFLWGVALIVLGILLFRGHDWHPAPAATTTAAEPGPEALPMPPSPEGAGESSHLSIEAEALPTGALTSTQTIPPPTPPVVPVPKERSGLGWMTMGLALLALGVASLLDVSGAVHLTLVQYLALVLSIIGFGLVVGAFAGRARWLVIPGILLVPLVLLASLIHVPFAGGTGDRTIRPASVLAIQPVYNLSAGQMFLDLRDTVFGSQPVAIRVTNVAGRILVLVPPSTPLDVRGRVGAGEVSLFGQTYDGFNVDVRRTYGVSEALGQPAVLVLDLETSLGQVEVSQ